ncbi:TPA: DUF2004 domain-containing protein [Neisseria gonorrhoeae]
MDAFAAFLSELEKADDAARAALTEYLKRDSRYIDFHTEDTQTSRDAAKFVRTMQLIYISLWAKNPAFAVMDYMPANMKSLPSNCIWTAAFSQSIGRVEPDCQSAKMKCRLKTASLPEALPL